jgi:hypothetical protein
MQCSAVLWSAVLWSAVLSSYLCSCALRRSFEVSEGSSGLGRLRYDAAEHLRGRSWSWWSAIPTHWQLLLLLLLLLLLHGLLLLRLILLWLLLVLVLLLHDWLHSWDRWNRR